MEMRVAEDVGIGQDLTPPLPPIAAVLHHRHLHTHCSACFSPLRFTPTISPNPQNTPSPFLRYCSDLCSALDSPLHFSSGEFDFLRRSPAATCPDSSSDLRLSLRLLQTLGRQNDDVSGRIGGLMTNREQLLRNYEEDDDVLGRIRNGAKAMAVGDLESNGARAMAVMCLVMTNAVEVQDSNGCNLGVAVYNTNFSWINHSCSPNSSYSFSIIPCSDAPSPSPLLINSYPTTESLSKIGGNVEIEEGYGPRLIVRSIKDIKKGDEVLITYTDLLQPKGMRQSELWLKYRFSCCCNRCNSDPPTYVDRVLQEISVVDLDCPTSTSSNNFDVEFATEKLNECFDDAFEDFLTFDNPKSCTTKLENLLIHGCAYEHLKRNGEKSRHVFKLHPFHHLSLDAYTTLASAYKVSANEFRAFKASAAYSFLLAGSAHHLFSFEPSLIVSVANFWKSAGESLLSLVGNSAEFSGQSCSKCSLHSRFEAGFTISEITNQFLSCITDLAPKVWHFLVDECLFLSRVKNPIDFRWIEGIEDSILPDHVVSSDFETDSKTETDVSLSLFQIGLHCSLYGSFLSSVCSA